MLTVTRAILQRHIGHYLGLSRDPSQWSDDEVTDCGDILLRGLRRFYHPTCLPGESTVHTWSFLAPWAFLSLSAGIGDYDLPEDFGGMVDELTYRTNATGWCPVRLVSENEIRLLRQRDGATVTGYPHKACVTPITGDGSTDQRWMLSVYPLPNGPLELKYRYQANPEAISGDKPYPLGGAQYAETLLEAVLAAAELHQKQEPGAHTAAFAELLRASVMLDRKNNVQTLGYNGDGDGLPRLDEDHEMILTYNGVEI